MGYCSKHGAYFGEECPVCSYSNLARNSIIKSLSEPIKIYTPSYTPLFEPEKEEPEETTCPACNGKGCVERWDHYAIPLITGGFRAERYEYRCHKCSGTGKVSTRFPYS